MKERRSYIRFNAQASVILKAEHGASRIIKSNLVDISFIGIAVYMQEAIGQGVAVQFELITELWEKPIAGDGEIIYVEQIKGYAMSFFRVGIDFINVDKKAIQHIVTCLQEDICSDLKKKEYSKIHSTKPRLP